MIDVTRAGFVYTFQGIDRDGKIKWEWTEHNILPDEGRDYLLNAGLLIGSQFGSWYVSIYSGSYTPQSTDTAANYASRATEITSEYSEANRILLVPDALSGGTYANIGSPAVFTFTGPVTVRGGGIHSAAGKGATTGVLLSIVAAPSPKSFDTGEQLKVIAGLTLTSA